MSNPLTQARQDLADLLKAGGINAFVTVTNPAPPPPLAAVGPNEPYLDYEGTLMYGEVNVRLVITLLARPGTTDVQAAELDELVITTLAALQENPEAPHYFLVEEVDRPGQVAVGGQQHLGCAVSVFKPVQLAPAG